MRKAIVGFGVLATVAALAVLWQSRGVTSARRTPGGGTPAPTTEGTIREDSARDAAEPAALDDLSRVPGPELTVRGRVTFLGRPRPDSLVRLYVHEPRSLFTPSLFDLPADQEALPLALGGARTGADGKFTLRTPRRSRLRLVATAPDAAPLSVTLWIPPTGDPDAITLALKPGCVLRGLIVDAEGRVRFQLRE